MLQLKEQRTQTQSIKQNEPAQKYVPDKRTS